VLDTDDAGCRSDTVRRRHDRSRHRTSDVEQREVGRIGIAVGTLTDTDGERGEGDPAHGGQTAIDRLEGDVRRGLLPRPALPDHSSAHG
jgi:hypothetical protein